jgi:hypothetical protein
MRRTLTGLLTGLLLIAGLAATSAPATAVKPPWHGSYIQITKVTPTAISARIQCPRDPNPDGSQNFFLSVASPNDESGGYQLDVAALCDMKRHQVTVPFLNGVAPVVGTQVDVFGTISGDSGEVNVQYENLRVKR